MKFNFNKKNKSIVAVFLAILVIYVLAFLLIPFPKNAASWISFGFTIVAIIYSLFVCAYVFNSKASVKSKFYGFPIIRVGVIYAVVQLVIGITVCRIDAVTALPYWIALLISVLLLAAAAIGIIATDNTRDMVEEIEDAGKAQTFFVKSLTADTQCLIAKASNEAMKSELTKVYEAARYSDPVSNEALADVEGRITTALTSLTSAVKENNAEQVTLSAKELLELISERNIKCKAFK